MTIRVRVSGIPSSIVPQATVALPAGSTVGELVRRLGELGSKDAIMSGAGIHLVILVNGRNVASLDGLDTQLHDNDDVRLVLPAAGG